MVKTREDFRRLEDETIEPNAWFEHLAEKRNKQDVQILRQAYSLSLISGEDVPTITGEPCIQQGLNIADLLNNLSLDVETLAAAIIYPSVQYAELPIEDVTENLSNEISKLVEGVAKMDAIRNLYGESNQHARTQIDNIRKMLLAMAEDVRVVLIKLAEQTCIMRNIKHMGKTQQKQLAQETRDIYAPLANRLGIAQIKWELEDFAFRYLEPAIYRKIAKAVSQKRTDREKSIKNIIETLKNSIQKTGIKKFEVTGRAKHIYSIYNKMKKKNVDFDKIYDASAVRIFVPNVENCYAVLGIVQSLWTPIKEEFDDYISNPKPNGYRSLHTAFNVPEIRNLEIQIRTYEMHKEAELGIAAHWIYKEGGSSKGNYDQKIDWLRQVIDWQKELTNTEDKLESLTQRVFEDRVYVFTPTGEIFDLAKGATPLDFAYALHTEVGNRCRGAKIGGKIVQLTYQLKMGDKVEILTAKNPNPSRDWLNPNLGYLKTSRARSKVHAWLKKQDYDEHLAYGKEIVDRELKRLKISSYDAKKLISRFNYKTLNDLLAGLGRGDIKMGQVINTIETQISSETITETSAPIIHVKKVPARQDGITIQGLGNLLHHIANCCKPIPGDPIRGYITQGRGVSIHREDCSNILSATNTQKERLIEVSWGEKPGTFPVDIFVKAYDRPSLLRDITSILSNEKINVIALNTVTNKKENTATNTITIEIPNLNTLSKILAMIHQLPNVITAEREKGSSLE